MDLGGAVDEPRLETRPKSAKPATLESFVTNAGQPAILIPTLTGTPSSFPALSSALSRL